MISIGLDAFLRPRCYQAYTYAPIAAACDRNQIDVVFGILITVEDSNG